MNYPKYIRDAISRIESNGESAFIVGGSLRDMLLGTAPHDYDIATSALPEKTSAIFSDAKVIKTGIQHGTVTVILEGNPIEITTFRIDGSYTDSRHPDSVSFTSDIAADLSRRDFTVNAMAYSDSAGLIDIFGGREDIEKRIIRAVGDPDIRFTEDALRIMRAFRFSAQLGFDIESNTLAATARTAHRLSSIARERIASELLRLICSPSPTKPLIEMSELGIMPYVLGEYTPSPKILEAMEKAPSTQSSRLALLLAQADTQSLSNILSSLKCSNKLSTATTAIVRGAKLCVKTEQDARKLISITGIYAPDAARISTLLGISDDCAESLTLKQLNTPCSIRQLDINGKELAALGFTGKDIGNTLARLLENVIEEPKLNKKPILIQIAQSMKNN